MNYIDRMMKLQDLLERIAKGRTGNKAQLAKQLHMTDSSLRRRLEELKDMGADIQYDRDGKTYYNNNGFSMKVEVKTMDEKP